MPTFIMTQHNLPLKEYEWTPKLAYVVGLITTDGCLSPDGRHLTFTSCDKQLIETFKKILKLKIKLVKQKHEHCVYNLETFNFINGFYQ